MSFSKKNIFKTFIIIILIAISGYYLYSISNLQNISPLKAVPDNASLILKINSYKNLKEEIPAENIFWDAIYETENCGKEIKSIDSLIKTDNTISNIFNTNKIYFSLHNVNENNIDILMLIKIKKEYQKKYIYNFVKKSLKKTYAINTISYNNGAKIKYLISAENKKIFSYTIYKGIFLFSSNPEIIKQSVDQLSLKKIISKDDAFEKLILTEGKKNIGNVYINYKNSKNLLNTFSKNIFLKKLNNLTKFGLWSNLDITLKSNELFLNGFTSSSNTKENFVNIFNNQNIQDNSLTNFYPDNTLFFINFGFSNFKSCYKNYKDYLKENNRIINFNKNSKSLNLKYKTDIEKNLNFCLGNKIGLFITDNKNIADNTFAIFKIKNLKKTKTYFSWLSKQSGTKFRTKKYKGYKINNIKINNFLPIYFGDILSNFETSYFTIIDSNLIFANNYKSLKTIIKKYSSHKSLNKTKEYKNFRENTSDKSNIYLYCNTKNSENLRNYFLKNSSLSATKNSEIFQSISLQYSFEDNLIYTNFYLKYNPKYNKKKTIVRQKDKTKEVKIENRITKEDEKSNKSILKIKLDNTIYQQPYSVKTHTSKYPFIIAFDISNKIYLINNSGKIIWKKTLKEKPLSKIYIVDYYKNGRLQYLFNTSNYLYLLDAKGRNVADYPIKLKNKASNGISVFDYDNKKNYRIIYAANNKRIYNLTLKGKTARGWLTPKVRHTVNSCIQHLRTNKKDFIIIPQTNGNVLMTDRRGATKITIINSFNNALNSDFFINKTNNKGKIITTDKSGRLIYTSTKGKINKTYFNKFSKNHFFLYNNFSGNKNKDFIFLDKNKLSIYNRYKKRILSHTFRNNINVNPIFSVIKGRNNILGILDNKADEISLFNKNGAIKTKDKLTAETPFVIKKINSKLKLITGYKKYVYIYSID